MLDIGLRRAAVYPALVKYGRMPETEDHTASILLALVEADREFKPLPGYSGPGYRARWALSKAAVARLKFAQAVKDANERVLAFVDLPPDINPEQVEDPGRHANEAVWHVHSGQLMTAPEIVEAVMAGEGRDIAARALGMAEDDAELPVAILRQLDELAEEQLSNPTWLLNPPPREPVAGSIEDEGWREEVERASASYAAWLDPLETPVSCEERMDMQTAGRPVEMMRRDNYAWPGNVGAAFSCAARFLSRYGAVNRILTEGIDGLPGLPRDLLYSLRGELADIVDFEDFDRLARSIARVLAVQIGRQLTAWHDRGTMVESLRGIIVDFFGAEPDEWEPPERPTAMGLRQDIWEWVQRLPTRPSVKAEIVELIKGTPPNRAKEIGREVYGRAHEQ